MLSEEGRNHVLSEEGRVKNPCVKGKVKHWRLWRLAIA